MRAPRRASAGLFALVVASSVQSACGDDDDEGGPRAPAGSAGAAAGGGGQSGAGGRGGAGQASGAGGVAGAAGSEGGAGGSAGGAGGSFRCGLSSSECNVARQYCLLVFADLTEPAARCVDLPPACAAMPTCECAAAHARSEDAACTATANCSEQAAGSAPAFTVACRGTP
jgi:hypothetical protein